MTHATTAPTPPEEFPLAELEALLDRVLQRVSKLLHEPDPAPEKIRQTGSEVRMVSAIIRGYRQLRQWYRDRISASPARPSREKKNPEPEFTSKRGKPLTSRDKASLARRISENLQQNAAP